MSCELWAPYPDTETVVTLPSPALRDSYQRESRVLPKTMLNGAQYTNVRRQPSQTLYVFQFDCTRVKALEFWTFVKKYSGVKWKIENHDGETLIGFYRVNPAQLNVIKRAVHGTNKEAVTFEIEFMKVE